MAKNETIWRGVVHGGKIMFDNPQQFSQSVALLEGKQVTLTLKKFFYQRSTNANRLYWAYLRDMVQETDGLVTQDRIDSLHEYFKRQLLPPVIEKFDMMVAPRDEKGQFSGPPALKTIEFKRPKSTTELNSQEFSEYLRGIEMLTGISINYQQ